MVDDSAAREAPTRREYVKYGGAVIGGGVLAGCTGQSGPGSTSTDESTAADAPTETSTGTPRETKTATSNETTGNTAGTTAGGSYSVEVVPVGKVAFESTPETWSTYFPGYADMGVALGMADRLRAIGAADRYYTAYYEDLDGVSLDISNLTTLLGDSGIDKELFYEVDADVHLTDPNWLRNNSAFKLEESDIDTIATEVAPFVGNTVFRRTDEWHDYRYYTMYGAFEKVAEVFRRTDRYDAFETLHDTFLGDIQGDLPGPDERPAGLLVFAAGDEPEAFYPYRIGDRGTNKKHFHDLGVTDALAGTGIAGLSTNERGQIDYETILQVDPQAIFVRGHERKTRTEFEDTVVSFMKKHSIARELTAVQNGDVYRGGPIYQGPIQNLFLTERFARLLYPDACSDEELFDRGQVADIVDGNP